MRTRREAEVCRGQTLLCKALDLRVPDWDRRRFSRETFYIEDVGARPTTLIQSTRLGIPAGRDEHLMYRFIHPDFIRWCTSNPLTKRDRVPGQTYRISHNAVVA